MVPSSGTPAIAFCAKRLLSRLPRPAPPRSEFGEGLRGAELVVLPCAPELWVLWWWRWGEDRARARVRGTSPLTPSESLRDGERKGGGGLPVPPVPPVPRPCLPSRASLPRASASWPLPRRGCAARDALRCALGLCGCRLAPPSSAAFPRLVESQESPSPLGAGRTRVSRDGPRSRGRPVLGERRLVASGASSDVGTRCRLRVFGGRHRCRRGSLSCWCLTRAPVGPLGFRSARHRGRGGTAQGVCSVIPAGLPRVPGRRPSGLSVPCRGTFRGRPVAATPAVVAGPAAVAASCVVSEAACEGKSAPRG